MVKSFSALNVITICISWTPMGSSFSLSVLTISFKWREYSLILYRLTNNLHHRTKYMQYFLPFYIVYFCRLAVQGNVKEAILDCIVVFLLSVERLEEIRKHVFTVFYRNVWRMLLVGTKYKKDCAMQPLWIKIQA